MVVWIRAHENLVGPPGQLLPKRRILVQRQDALREFFDIARFEIQNGRLAKQLFEHLEPRCDDRIPIVANSRTFIGVAISM